MGSIARTRLSILGAGLLVFCLATESLAQGRGGRSGTRDPILRGNPYRDIGGSCVYDRDGKVLFAPPGATCRDATNHLTSSEKTKAPILDTYPPALRPELSRLLGDHDHLREEIARARQAIEVRDPALALEAMNKLGEELADHRVREERFLERIAPSRASP